MRLKFGDDNSIKLRDEYARQKIVDELLPKVKCPFCKAPAYCAYEVDLENKCIGWNFECKPSCPNSIEYAENNCYENSKTFTDLKGKFKTYDYE